MVNFKIIDVIILVNFLKTWKFLKLHDKLIVTMLSIEVAYDRSDLFMVRM